MARGNLRAQFQALGSDLARGIPLNEAVAKRNLPPLYVRMLAIGARIVARAWADPAYKKRLLADADAAIAELGFGGQQGESMRVVENSSTVHNVVVCTLCSCYPWAVLGLPPVWYKSTAYRARSVIDPRGVLREFGLELSDDVQVRVWDSTADLRYLVLPERPANTNHMSENELAGLVTRDSMIGTSRVKS